MPNAGNGSARQRSDGTGGARGVGGLFAGGRGRDAWVVFSGWKILMNER
ncbi:hypothetical protein [Streptomyces sp. 3N207]